MNSVTRTFGKLTHRSPGDNARVSNLLNDYEDVDKLLAKVNYPMWQSFYSSSQLGG